VIDMLTKSDKHFLSGWLIAISLMILTGISAMMVLLTMKLEMMACMLMFGAFDLYVIYKCLPEI
jgi:hypothetical protein